MLDPLGLGCSFLALTPNFSRWRQPFTMRLHEDEHVPILRALIDLAIVRQINFDSGQPQLIVRLDLGIIGLVSHENLYRDRLDLIFGVHVGPNVRDRAFWRGTQHAPQLVGQPQKPLLANQLLGIFVDYAFRRDGADALSSGVAKMMAHDVALDRNHPASAIRTTTAAREPARNLVDTGHATVCRLRKSQFNFRDRRHDHRPLPRFGADHLQNRRAPSEGAYSSSRP